MADVLGWAWGGMLFDMADVLEIAMCPSYRNAIRFTGQLTSMMKSIREISELISVGRFY